VNVKKESLIKIKLFANNVLI